MTSTPPPRPFSGRGSRGGTERDELCLTFETALVYLNRGIEQLRRISPAQANRAARQVNLISEIVLQAVLDCDSPRKLLDSPPKRSSAVVRSSHFEDEAGASVGYSVLPRDTRKEDIPPRNAQQQGRNLATSHLEQAVPRQDAVLVERTLNVQGGNQLHRRATPGEEYRRAGPAPHERLDPFPPLATWETSTNQDGVSNGMGQPVCCNCGGEKNNAAFPRQPTETVASGNGDDGRKTGPANNEYIAHSTEHAESTQANDENQVAGNETSAWTGDHAQTQVQTIKVEPTRFAATWAKVAAIKPTEPVSFGRTQRSATFPLSNGPPRGMRKYSVVRQTEPIAEQRRVVWLINCPEKMTLREVSMSITEGALMSVVFVDDHDEICPGRAACIIFQRAEAAQAFYEANRAIPPEGQTSRYGKGIRAELGGNFPADEDIQSMNLFPNGARRRLTFVRSQLFVGLSRARFERDVKAIAGADNVELIHIYNTGNATVVLASVKVAKALLKQFQMYAAREGPYKEVEVSYSKDPCEAEMRLISAFIG